MNRFENLGVIKNEAKFDEVKLNQFENKINKLKQDLSWNKDDIINFFFDIIPDFGHKEKGKYLDEKM